MNLTPTPIPWYSASGYAEIIQQIPQAGGGAPASYEAWMEQITEIENDLRLVGRLPVRVEIQPQEITAWCEENGRKLDLSAVKDYATLKMASKAEERVSAPRG